MIFGPSDVIKFLPHRDPFLFVDRVIAIVLSRELENQQPPFTISQLLHGKVHCQFEVKHNLVILQGHFPGHPILPGVIQVEMMAQAASFLCVKARPSDEMKPFQDVALLGVDGAKFRKPIYPGMTLDIFSTLNKTRGHILNFDCEIYCGSELMSQAQILASIKL